MKNLILSTLIALTATTGAFSQTVYTIKENTKVTSLKKIDRCSHCVINISEGVTLTVDENMYIQNTSFNGGNIVVNDAKITFWSEGQFNDVKLTFNKNSGLVSSGELNIKNSSFTFNSNATAVLWSTVNMDNSAFRFLGNSSFEATSTVNLSNKSSLAAGDGTAESKAFIKFNGGTLNEYDNSYVTLLNFNNYYYNWSDYSSSGQSFKTTNLKLNCGTTGTNKCSAPVVYGPSLLNSGGVSNAAILPIKLAAFAAKLEGNKVAITWTTAMEQNAARFDIERSVDGITWVKAGSVNAHVNSSVAIQYAFTDFLKTGGVINYRLKMIDQDETFEYSPVKIVKLAIAVEMNIYPNPATDYVVISAKNNTDKMNIQLIGLSGQVMKQVNGSGRVNMSVNDVHAGNYFVRVVDAAGSAQTFKLMIAK